jgi:hypothetical protein
MDQSIPSSTPTIIHKAVRLKHTLICIKLGKYCTRSKRNPSLKKLNRFFDAKWRLAVIDIQKDSVRYNPTPPKTPYLKPITLQTAITSFRPSTLRTKNVPINPSQTHFPHHFMHNCLLTVNPRVPYGIEKDKDAFERLKNFLKENNLPNVITVAQNGEFYELREKILDWCGRVDFTFFFIDPEG